jgi:NAD(P)-dependent dehydrogenase (short-subunit alcohol dehydrogenase family)
MDADDLRIVDAVARIGSMNRAAAELNMVQSNVTARIRLLEAGKMGQPEEIATVALFLASDDSSFVNGVELAVDGGLSAI